MLYVPLQELQDQHSKESAELQDYYEGITTSNLDAIQQLRKELAEVGKKEASASRALAQVTAENRALHGPLAQVRAPIPPCVGRTEPLLPLCLLKCTPTQPVVCTFLAMQMPRRMVSDGPGLRRATDCRYRRRWRIRREHCKTRKRRGALPHRTGVA